MNRVRIFARGERPESAEVATTLVARGTERGLEIGADVTAPECVIAVGGDGTVLGAAAMALREAVPVCGINVGRVGYLAEFEPARIDALLDALVEDTYTTERRVTIDAEVDGTTATAINDVVVEKLMSHRIIELAVSIDGEPLATYRADGVIVSTPTGSTAYNLSAGGPIVTPDVDAMVLTPVAPHSLLSRAMVVAPGSVVELTISGDRPGSLNVDGVNITDLAAGATTRVTRGARDIVFLTLGDHRFPIALREHFGLRHA